MMNEMNRLKSRITTRMTKQMKRKTKENQIKSPFVKEEFSTVSRGCTARSFTKLSVLDACGVVDGPFYPFFSTIQSTLCRVTLKRPTVFRLVVYLPLKIAKKSPRKIMVAL